MHDVHTVCSEARTDTECVTVAQELETAQSHCIIPVRPRESVIRSAMSHPCWPLPHLLTSPVPQHAAQPGPRDLLQEDTVHPEQLPQEPLPKTSANAIWSESNAKESLSDPNCESGGNLRPNTPTGYEPEYLTTREIAAIPTISGSSLEDIYQFCYVQREFGEQDQQAPVIEEVKECGQVEAQSLLDHEMAEMSPIEKMSCHQSRMHFDESMESNVDFDLEDGEIRKLLTSPMYA